MIGKLFQLLSGSPPNLADYTEGWVIARYGGGHPYVLNGDLAQWADATIDGLQQTEVFYATDKAQANRIAEWLNESATAGISYSPALRVRLNAGSAGLTC